MRFDGETYDPPRDEERLTTQLLRVQSLMSDGRWRTLPQIAQVVEGSEPAVSARLRDLRKPRFGGYRVERKYVDDGVWMYRVLAARGFDSVPPAPTPRRKGRLF